MRTRSLFTAVVEIPLPPAAIWIAEGDEETNMVHASVQGTDAYSHRIETSKLVVQADSVISVEDAKEALKVWADFVASKLDDEIGYGR